MPRRCAPRRLAALATAVVVVVLAAAPAAAGAGRAGDRGHRAARQVSIEIVSVSPDYAQPKSTITVSGMVDNPTATTMPGLSVRLWSSSTPLFTREAMTEYLGTPGLTAVDTEEGTPGPVFSLAAHKSMQWTLTLRPSQVGMHSFGVYPLAAQLSGPIGQVARARTFLPFWPGKPASRAVKPLNVSWVWPLIDAPQQAACPALRNDSLAGSLAAGGRLNGLLAAGSSGTGGQAALTWAIDPALISDATRMTIPYRYGVTPTCSGGTAKPADAAAATWLSGVRNVAGKQNFFVTPYADVDVAALAHRGLDTNLVSAFRSGRDAAVHSKFLGRIQHTTPGLTGSIAWPPGGTADYGVLEGLAHNGIRTVILDSGIMPPPPRVPYTPSALTSTPDGLGSQLHVLLADHTLARILDTPQSEVPGAMPAPPPAADAGGAAQGLAQAATFAEEQWFFSETAMIAYELPGTARSVVIMPPRRWNPPAGLAHDLLDQTVHTPWLRPTTLASVVAAGQTAGSVHRRPPPEHKLSDAELREPLLHQVGTLTGQTHLLANILTDPGRGFLSTAVAAVESSAWRGSRASQRRAEQQLRRVSSYVRSQLQQVSIVHSVHVTLGGKSGPVPVSISNQLGRAIQVKLQVNPSASSRLTIGPYPGQFKAVTVGPGAQRLIKIPVRSAAAGSTTLTLQLTTPEGTPLPGGPASLTVEATHFGTLAIVIIVVALVVFVSTATARAIRRGSEPSQSGAPGDESPDPADDEFATPPFPSAHEPGEPGKEGENFRGAAEPASPGTEADSVVTAGATDADPAKEADDHASTPGRAHRL